MRTGRLHAALPVYNAFLDALRLTINARYAPHAPPPVLAPARMARAVATHTFQAVQADDLPFRKGDVLTILSKVRRPLLPPAISPHGCTRRHSPERATAD